MLEVCGLTYHYPGSARRIARGIEGVNLRLARGSFTVIAGGRGAGKSTLLRALLGLLPGARGEIRWNGTPINASVLDVVKTDGLAPNQTLAGGGFTSSLPRCVYLAQARPEDAQAMRKGIARLLESEAELLLIDDLSAMLSIAEERKLWDALFARRLFWRRGACLAVSNRQPALSRADHILVLREGRPVGKGGLQELLQCCAEMQRIWGTDPRKGACLSTQDEK